MIIAAPRSAGGKSLVCLCLLAGYARRGLRLAAAKVGPDYIDAAFHRAAGGCACVNLDAWGMRASVLGSLAADAGRGAELLLAEGVMGLFDGARDGTGATADIADMTGWPVVLVLDGRGAGRSVGAVAKGFAGFRAGVDVCGVILNRVASPLHRRLLEAGCQEAGVSVLGAMPEDGRLRLPHRHLGLVQAQEHPDLKALLRLGADMAEAHIDMDRLRGLARPCAAFGVEALGAETSGASAPFAPPAQHVAVARDEAFSFAYPHWFDAWRRGGAELSFFSPLAGEAPHKAAGFVFLPGGYPQLHAGRLAAAAGFLDGLRAAARRGAILYGECGGYIALGQGLEDEAGTRHAFAGLLPLESRFSGTRALGYRRANLLAGGFLGAGGDGFRGHEFHFVAETPAANRPPALFDLTPPSAGGEEQKPVPSGMAVGNVMGSFLHLIDRAPDARRESAPCPSAGRGSAASSRAAGRRPG